MNTDIRLSVGFWQHPKVFRLEKQLGLKAIRFLQILWFWCAQNRPDGNLAELDAEDIEFVADWRGKKGAFVKACESSWLDTQTCRRSPGLWLIILMKYGKVKGKALLS